MHELIASQFLDDCLLLRPGSPHGVKIGPRRHHELRQSTAELCPAWMVDVVGRRWPGLDLTGRRLGDTVLVRPVSPFGYGRASYELNLGCNYDCEHCYLGLKKFDGLSWPDRERLLHIMRDAGVLWLQLTGGEPLIDKLFTDVYRLAFELGMMLSLSSNGSRLHNPVILELLTELRPYRLTISVYGATAESYDGLTRRRGSFDRFMRGMTAATEAGLPMNLNLIVTNTNAHEVDDMKALADRFDLPYHVFSNMSPTIYGGAESLPAQSQEYLRKRKPFTGCSAGHTFFHVDPHGMASICKVGRDPQIPLMDDGVDGLTRLGGIADKLLLRQGGCTGCQLQGSCGTCMPLVTEMRLGRQEVLKNTDQHFWFVIHEAALRSLENIDGDSSILEGQARHLLEAAGQPNIEIQVAPFRHGYYPGQAETYMIFGFGTEPAVQVTYVEKYDGGDILHDGKNLTRFSTFWDHQRVHALGPEQTRPFLRELSQPS